LTKLGRYRVQISKEARRGFDSLSKRRQKKVARAMLELADNPRPYDSKNLVDQGSLYRFPARRGWFTYEIRDDEMLVRVLTVLR